MLRRLHDERGDGAIGCALLLVGLVVLIGVVYIAYKLTVSPGALPPPAQTAPAPPSVAPASAQPASNPVRQAPPSPAPTEVVRQPTPRPSPPPPPAGCPTLAGQTPQAAFNGNCVYRFSGNVRVTIPPGWRADLYNAETGVVENGLPAGSSRLTDALTLKPLN